MDTILRRLPSQSTLQRRAPALAGFAFGGLALILGGMLVTVVYEGKGFFIEDRPAEVIYPNL